MTGYSGTPLLKKPGIKEGFKIYIQNPPENYFHFLGPMPPEVKIVKSLKKPLDFIALFLNNQQEYEIVLPQVLEALAPNGMIWASWPKVSSQIKTDLSDTVIRQFALKKGLVDIKVCAVDETWSGLKLVTPVKDRK
jgi:hypothetical protein